MTVATSCGNAVTTQTIAVRCPYCGALIVNLSGPFAGEVTVSRDACPDRRCSGRVRVIVAVP